MMLAMCVMQEQHSQLEAAVLFLDAVVTAVSTIHQLDRAVSPSLDATFSATQALLQMLLGARFADPILLNWQARSLECFSKVLAKQPDLVLAVIQKASPPFFYCKPAFISILCRMPCVYIRMPGRGVSASIDWYF